MNEIYQTYLQILNNELLPAMGCTEPIALAYCAALARETLGVLPDRLLVEVSGNIVKNVKSVVVPNTGDMRGLAAAAAAGVVAGRADKKLEVLAEVSEAQIAQIQSYIKEGGIQIELVPSHLTFDIVVTAKKDASYAKVRIAKQHTNVVLIEKDGKILTQQPVEDEDTAKSYLQKDLTIEQIYQFAENVRIEDVKSLLDQQIRYNYSIAEEGIRGSYGANIGSTLLKAGKHVLEAGGEDAVKLRAKAMAAAGSDARMSGCEMPVIINSGSGNQGITVSVPVIVYARALKSSDEKLYRALTLANLIAVYQRAPIGTLSAYCGVINAGIAAACGIAYLKGADLDMVIHTMVNALAIASGVVCDGAKPSCAGKIALAVDCGLLGYEMYQNKQQFFAGDGIVKKGAEAMIQSVGRLGRIGMAGTDREILRIMLGD